MYLGGIERLYLVLIREQKSILYVEYPIARGLRTLIFICSSCFDYLQKLPSACTTPTVSTIRMNVFRYIVTCLHASPKVKTESFKSSFICHLEFLTNVIVINTPIQSEFVFILTIPLKHVNKKNAE